MPLPGQAQELRKTLHVGQSEVYVYDRMTTAAVGSPLVADIVPLSSHQLLVNAKGLGETTLIVCDHAGTHRLRLFVVPLPPFNLRPMAAQVQTSIGLPGVTAHMVQDTLFLEGTVSSAIAWQRAAAIAGVYGAKVKNLLTVVPDTVPTESLAQTYAALLSPSLAPLGVTCTVVGDKTLALSGQYAGRINTPGGTPDAADWPAPTPRRKSAKQPAATDAGDDAPDLATAPKEAKSTAKKSAETLPSDPLDHLIQSLPPDLKIINMLNLGSGPARQILVRAKIIDIDRAATKSLGLDWGTGSAVSERSGNGYSFQPAADFVRAGRRGGRIVFQLLRRRRLEPDFADRRPAFGADYGKQSAGLKRAEFDGLGRLGGQHAGGRRAAHPGRSGQQRHERDERVRFH